MRIGLRHGDGRFFSFSEKGDTLVGRAEGSTIRLDDDGVAERHARIRITSLGIEIDDLGSGQRTIVNAYPITKHFLSRADQVRIGTASLLVEADADDEKVLPRCRRCGAEIQSVSDPFCAHCTAMPRKGSSRFRVVQVSEPPLPPAQEQPAADYDPIEDTQPIQVKRRPGSITERIPVSRLAIPLEGSNWEERGALPAELVPDYVAIGVLGEGSQGRVYKLRHRTSGEIVAAKHLWNASPKALSRLEREIEALKRLRHQALVSLIDVRVPAGGSALILMEHVDGPSLATLIKRTGFLEPRRAITLAARIADGLAFAATRQVVHRDVKPSNILVGPGEMPKLIDFGLVTFGDRATRLTAEGQWIGTPHYMAPEQMTGATIDARTDVWGLAVTFYHVVTGKLPFEASLPAELFKKVSHDEPDLAAVEKAAGPKARALFERMLAKRPEERPEPAEVAQELAKLANAERHG